MIWLLACVSLPVMAAARTASAGATAATAGTAAATGTMDTCSAGSGQGDDEAVPSALPVALSDTKMRTLLNLVNEERKDARLSLLTLDGGLCIVARRHAEDMIRSGYFGHRSPSSGTLATRLAAAGVAFEKAGENLAGNTSAPDAHRMLMQSPIHRGNILNPDFATIGVAVVEGGPYGMMIVEVFADGCAPETSEQSSQSRTP